MKCTLKLSLSECQTLSDLVARASSVIAFRLYVSYASQRNVSRDAVAHCLSPLFVITVHYEDITENDRRVKFLWKALENFTNGRLCYTDRANAPFCVNPIQYLNFMVMS